MTASRRLGLVVLAWLAFTASASAHRKPSCTAEKTGKPKTLKSLQLLAAGGGDPKPRHEFCSDQGFSGGLIPTPKGLILIAEGDRELRSTLVEFLELEGFDVLGVSNAAKVVDAIRAGQRRPDLVVLDLNVSVLSGWNFLAMRLADPLLLLIPVVVLSDRPEAPPQAPRSTFLLKPVDLEKLAVVIRRVLDESSPGPDRLPRRSEPWSVDEKRPNVVRNRFGHVVAFIGSEREARRIVAAVNGTSRLSNESLGQGIVEKGLECLQQLDRYDSDEAYRDEVNAGSGLASILERRAEIARMLGATPCDESESSKS